MKYKLPCIALIEDDPALLVSISWKLKDLGTIKTADNLDLAQKLLNQVKPKIAIIDLHLREESNAGKKLISFCKMHKIPSIVITSDERPELINELYDLGATHFLVKKNFIDLLHHYVNVILKTTQNNYFEDIFSKRFITLDLNFQNKIKDLWSMPLQGESLHISGPTGSGKSLLAELYHKEIFSNTPFIHLNCAEISETLLESELFGHQKGAFTSAEKSYQGKLSLANNGVLFLDEIGCLSLTLQAKLLKVLESKSFYPVGSNQKIKVNFTLITATWEDLFEKTKNKEFRLDLLQRIMHYRIEIPALKHRTEDLLHYISHWMNNYPRKFHMLQEAQNILLHYDFPGNFRELKSILLQMAQTPKGEIDLLTLKNYLHPTTKTEMEASSIDFSQLLQDGIKSYLQKLEKKIVIDSYERNNYQVTAVLNELKLSPSSFYRITQLKD